MCAYFSTCSTAQENLANSISFKFIDPLVVGVIQSVAKSESKRSIYRKLGQKK
jgi:hypothetical protein